MLPSSYEIRDIELLLGLSDSARKTLLIILDQFNGASSGTFDRSCMSNAEKQRLKRGIAELKQKELLIKNDRGRSYFSLNPAIIQAKIAHTREEHYLRSGHYKKDCNNLLHILIAIEHFFDDFFNSEFVIKFKIYSNKPRVPATVFNAIVAYTNQQYADIDAYAGYCGSVLNEFIRIGGIIKFYADSKQTFWGITPDIKKEIRSAFTDVFRYDSSYCYPAGYHADAKALDKFVHTWFADRYPEYLF